MQPGPLPRSGRSAHPGEPGVTFGGCPAAGCQPKPTEEPAPPDGEGRGTLPELCSDSDGDTAARSALLAPAEPPPPAPNRAAEGPERDGGSSAGRTRRLGGPLGGGEGAEPAPEGGPAAPTFCGGLPTVIST